MVGSNHSQTCCERQSPEGSVKRSAFAIFGIAIFAVTLPALTGCSGVSAATSSPPANVSGPAVLTASGTYALGVQAATIALPALAASSDNFTATFPAMSVPATLSVEMADGPSSFTIPQAQAIWAPKCPWPLETIGMMFSENENLSATPQIAFTTSRLDLEPTYFDAVLADSTANTIVAQQQVKVAAGAPADSGNIPSMNSPWNVVAGHQYVMEIVASTSQFLSCSGTYN